MERVFVLQKIESDLAFLKSEDGDLNISWPVTALPEGFSVGAKLNFMISLNDIDKVKRSQAARDILNEILN
jgi:hypothetical protein